MTYDREAHKAAIIRALQNRGLFIGTMGVIGFLFYWLDIAGSRKHWLIMMLGTIFCIFASLRMFWLAYRVNQED